MITFLISGLWHGASWHFVIWGGMHGAFQVLGDLTAGIRKRLQVIFCVNTECFSYRLFQQISTFILVDAAWFFFRVEGFSTAVEMLKKLVTDFNLPVALNGKIYLLGIDEKRMLWLVLSIALLLIVDGLHEMKISIRGFLEKQNIVFRWICYLVATFVLVLAVLQDYGAGAASFIYFQF